ncbi:MAG: hypothetical protein GF368_03250 [Candidatus Aenigmarchaeota archaeon]|nr:hypothetical protein [Candidatus Aenigmarchaeota archaeon]
MLKKLVLVVLILSLVLVSCVKENKSLEIGELGDFIYLDGKENISTFNFEGHRSSVFIDLDKRISSFDISRDGKILSVQIPGGSEESNYSQEGPCIIVINLEKKRIIKEIKPGILAGISPMNEVYFMEGNDEKVNGLKLYDTSVKKIKEIDLNNISNIDWSPNGKKVVYTKRINRMMRLFVTDLTSSKTIELLKDKQTNKYHPSWSIDGTIIFISFKDGDFGIYSTTLNKDDIQLIIKSDLVCANPVISIEDKKILFKVLEKDNSWNIYMVNEDGSNLTRILNLGENGTGKIEWIR